MKKKLLFLIILLQIVNQSFAQTGVTGINTKTPNNKSALHTDESGQSTPVYKGILVARYTTAQRDATFTSLGANDNSLLIYNTTENCYNYWKYASGSGSWISICGCTTDPSIPLLYYSRCNEAVVTPNQLTIGVNASGTVVVPITVISAGTINAINQTINGVTFTMPATAVTGATTSITINFSGAPTTATNIDLPINDNKWFAQCHVIIPVNNGFSYTYTCGSTTPVANTIKFVQGVNATGSFTVPVSVTGTGTIPATSVISNGITYTTSAIGGANPSTTSVTVNYSGTPTVGATSSTFTIGSPTCTYTFAVDNGLATLNCAGATYKSGNTLIAGTGTNTIVYGLPYTNGNGGSYNSLSIASTGVTGLTATINSGNFAVGSGSIDVSISGTPNTSGKAYFTIALGGSTCTLSINVIPQNTVAVVPCDDSMQFGRNITTDPTTWTNITLPNGDVVGVRAVPSGGLSGSTFCNPQQAFGNFYSTYCGVTCNAAVNMRIGSSLLATGSACNNNSVKFIFNRPVNDISVHSTWYYTLGVNLEGADNLSMSVNGGGTLAYATYTSCPTEFSITSPSANTVKATATGGAFNSNGIVFRLRASQPFTELTLFNVSGGDDVIATLSYCSAVAY